MLETIVVDSPLPAKYAIIWCHGLGADGHDFVPIAHELQRLVQLPLRFIFPHAELRPVTLNNGYVMRAWYDILGLDLKSREDREGLDEASEKIGQLIQQQVLTGIPSENIFLGGFSQGAGAILYTGLRYPQKLAGLAVFSGYLPFYQSIQQEKHGANQHTPIFWGHGLQDLVVPYAWAELSTQALKSSGHTVDLYPYAIAHQVSEEEIMALADWMRHQLI